MKNVKKDEINIEDNKTYYCIAQLSNKCKNKNGLLSEKDFYMATNQELFKNKKVHICKNCIKEYVYIDGEVKLERFKKILMLIDYPFYSNEFESAFKDPKETVGVYMKNITLNHKDAIWINGDTNYEKSIVNNELIEEETCEITPKIIKFWGKNYSKEEYTFLQEYYNDLIKIYDHSVPIQVNNYRNMAKTQLQANKCLESGDMGGYDKAMKILSMLSGDSNIKPVQKTDMSTALKGGYDVFLAHIENDEPILDWEKDLGHVNKLKYYLSVFFFGNLSRALNIKNPWKEEFEKEMKQYTVEESEVEEEKNQVDFLGEK